MIYPENLTKGDRIGVTAPSAGFDEKVDLIRLDSGIRHFKDMGYRVVETDHVRTSTLGRSADGATRAKELMQLFTDPGIKAIIAACGGDYLFEMLSFIDFEQIQANPKWMQGFSDITGILFTITTNLDIATLYGYNFSSFGMEHWHPSLVDNLRILEGCDICQKSFDRYQDGYRERITGLEEIVPEKDVKWVNLYPDQWDTDKELTIEGRALGGCMDVLLTLIGTRFDKTREFIHRYRDDKIVWFLESFSLNSEAMASGLWQMKEAGWFEHAAGFIFGRPAMYESDMDITYEQAVCSVLGELKLPIILEADIGHKPPQFTMMNGAMASVRSYRGEGSIIFERR